MENSELLEKFPECNAIKADESVAAFLESLFSSCKTYREISGKILSHFEKLWACPNCNCDNTAYKRWADYFYGHLDASDGGMNLSSWANLVSDEFFSRNGQRRTFEEACKIASDLWTDMIFKPIVQYNGDTSSNGLTIQALGTLVKERAISNINDDAKKTFNEKMRDYYLSGCLYKIDNGDGTSFETSICPYSDYGPNSPLYDILSESGIDVQYIDSICPWKTGVTIDKLDNTVVLKTYHKTTYI